MVASWGYYRDRVPRVHFERTPGVPLCGQKAKKNPLKFTSSAAKVTCQNCRYSTSYTLLTSKSEASKEYKAMMERVEELEEIITDLQLQIVEMVPEMTECFHDRIHS
jgi:uncharacterized protein (UPF0179 family)